jgi:AcrR family transcriptional regulator
MRVTAETKHATRRRILEVARRQFAQQGFEATTTRDIARGANIAVGTLFNYFPTKESIVECLVRAAWAEAAGALADGPAPGDALSLEEELFAHLAAVLRKLKPYRQYLPAVLDTAFSPVAAGSADGQPLRAAHLEAVCRIVSRHGHHDALSAVALQLYWTLVTGALAFWAGDSSPRQEDTLALLDQSLAMFTGWLVNQANDPGTQSKGG